MSTETLDETTTTSGEETPGLGYTLIKAPSSPQPVEEDEVADEKPSKPWFSGYCGPGPTCNDERHLNNVGETIRHCLYVGENGAKAPKRFLYCACACHRDPARAGQANALGQ